MTFGLFGLAAAILLWPGRATVAGRIAVLRADRRLAPVPAARPVASATGPGSASRRRRVGLVSGPVAIAVSISTASLGWAAAVEFGLCAFLVTLVLVSVVNQIVDRRRQAAGAAMVSLALALLAGELAAGASPASALSAASEAGVDIGARIDGPAGPDDHVARVVVAWQFSAETGVALADLVGRVRADLADAVAGRRDLSTVAAGPQASAAVLAALPVLGVALGAAMGADPLGVLFGTPAGRLLLCLGVALDAAGVAWTMRLVARARR